MRSGRGLEDDEVHVWRAALDLRCSQIVRLQRTLSPDEHARARRFRFQRDRDRFIVTRGLLRIVLAHYLRMDPGQVGFCYGSRGKPALAMPDRQPLRFSVSHADGLALFAVTRGREVGVDLERIRPHLADEDVEAHWCSPQEIAILRALPVMARREAFFVFWVRKEAYLKARGDGLSIPPADLDVSLSSATSALSPNINGDRQESLRWALDDLDPGPGFAAALAVEGHDWRLEGPAISSPVDILREEGLTFVMRDRRKGMLQWTRRLWRSER